MDQMYFERWHTNKRDALKYLKTFIVDLKKKKNEDPKIIFLLADVFTILEDEVYEGMSYEDLAL